MIFLSIRQSRYSRLISLCLVITFVVTMVVTPRTSYAQGGVPGLPEPGTMVNLSSSYVPLMITGLTVHPENPLLMDFIVSTGNSGLNAAQVKEQSNRLIKYFLACLTIPENDQWVNLSPYEKQRIVPENLGQTVLGQDMLAQDYLLKQLTASLIYPEKNLGKSFWDKIYVKAGEMYGTTQIPVNTFNKVWILPDTAKVYEHKDTVFVVKSHLKVMLDEDYLALSHNVIPAPSTKGRSPEGQAGIQNKNDINTLGNKIVREIILPAIEQEVNTGKNFANLRQIYNSMILAVWFKKSLKQALLNQVYTDKAKVSGVNVDDPAIKEKIYKQYLQAYKKGVFNYIKEEVNKNTQEIVPRKYFSGGLTPVKDLAMATADEAMAAFKERPAGSMDYRVSGLTQGANGNPAYNNVVIGSSPEEVDEVEGKKFDSAMTTPIQIARGVAYWEGKTVTTSITRPFRASRQEDVTDITTLSPSEKLRLENIAIQSLLQGQGVFAMMVAGASSRMNVKDAPPEVRSLSHENIQSKAGVPIGVIDGQAITYLDAFGINVSRLMQKINEESKNAGISNNQLDKNEVLLMSNDDYIKEQEGIIAGHHNYGLLPQQIRFFNQPLEPVYWATPADVEKLKAKFKSESDYQEALIKARDIQKKLAAGEKDAVVVQTQHDPLGHGEFLHQLIVSGELLHMFDTGKKWFFIKNVDNYASKFDRVWLQILGRFLDQKNLDFQPEVSPRAPAQSGGSLIVMEDTRSQQLAEDHTLKATIGPDGKPIVSPTDSFWFNDAVAVGHPEYVASLYFKPGQTLDGFLAEYRQAVKNNDKEALEAIAERGRVKFPKLLDPKPAKNGPGAIVKIETNMWQSTGVAPKEMKIESVGVRGARNFRINEYPSMSPQEQLTELANLRFLATKQWTIAPELRAQAKTKLAALLGREVTDAEVDLTLESYEGNKRIADDLLHYILKADLITKGILSTAKAGEAKQAMTVKPVNAYEDFYKSFGAMDRAPEDTHITQKAVDSYSATFLTPNAQMLPPSQRRLNETWGVNNGPYGVTEVYFVPEGETRRRMVAFQTELKLLFGDKIYLVDADRLHLTILGLEEQWDDQAKGTKKILAVHSGLDRIDPNKGAILEVRQKALSIETPAVEMQVARLNFNPRTGVFWELRPYITDPPNDPIKQRRKAWGLPEPRPPHITAAYFTQEFTTNEEEALRTLLAKYSDVTHFGDIDIDNVKVIAYSNFAFNASQYDRGYTVLESVPFKKNVAVTAVESQSRGQLAEVPQAVRLISDLIHMGNPRSDIEKNALAQLGKWIENQKQHGLVITPEIFHQMFLGGAGPELHVSLDDVRQVFKEGRELGYIFSDAAMTANALESDILKLMKRLKLSDYKRFLTTMNMSVDTVFINELAKKTGKSIDETLKELEQIDFFKPIVYLYRMRNPKEQLKNEDFKKSSVDITVSGDQYDFQGQKASLGHESHELFQYMKYMGQQAGQVPFVFRDGMKQFVGRFLGLEGVTENTTGFPDLLDIVNGLETNFLNKIDLKNTKYLITSGIGANEMYSHQLSEYLHSLGIIWIVVNNPDHMDRIPLDATNDNTIVFEMSRSGGTQETFDFFQRTAKTFKKRVVAAVQGQLKMAGEQLAKQDKEAVVYSIIDIPGYIGGRQMNRKTLMVAAPLFLALAVGSQDTKTAREGLKQYFSGLYAANEELAYKNQDNNTAVKLAEQLLTQRTVGRNKIQLLFGESLKGLANEIYHLANEGAQKYVAGGYENNNLVYEYNLNQSDDVERHQIGLEADPKSVQPLFLLDKSSDDYEKMKAYAEELKAKGFPVIVVTVDLKKGGSQAEIDQNLKTIARTSALMQDTVVYFTYLTRQDANSNPAVKLVRELTGVAKKRIAGIRKAGTENPDIRMTIQDFQTAIETSSRENLAAAQNSFSATGEPQVVSQQDFVPMKQAIGQLANALNISEEDVVGQYLGSITKSVMQIDIGEAANTNTATIDAAFGLSELNQQLGTSSAEREITPITRQLKLYDTLDERVSVGLKEGELFNHNGNIEENLARYLYGSWSKNKANLDNLVLTYMERDEGNPIISFIAYRMAQSAAKVGLQTPIFFLPKRAHSGIEGLMARAQKAINVSIVYTQADKTSNGNVDIGGITVNDATYMYGISNVIRMFLGGSRGIIFEVKNDKQLKTIQATINKVMDRFDEMVAKDRAMTVTDPSILEWKSPHGLSLREILIKIIKEYDIRFFDGYDDKNFPGQVDAVLLRWIGRALGTSQFTSSKHGRSVGLQPGDIYIVGGDNGPSTDELVKKNEIEGLLDTGVNVIDLGTTISGHTYKAIELLKRAVAQYSRINGGSYTTRSHVEVGTNGIKPVVGGITLYGDMLKAILETILTASYREADKRGELLTADPHEAQRIRALAKKLYFDSLRKDYKGLKDVVSKLGRKVAINLNSGSMATDPDYQELIKEIIGAENIETFLKAEPDPWATKGLADPTRADEKALAHPQANIVKYSKDHPQTIVFNFDLDVDRISILWGGQLYLGDEMFYPIIAYQYRDGMNPYAKLMRDEVELRYDSRMKYEIWQLARHFGAKTIIHAKGHSKVKATMDVKLAAIAAKQGMTVQQFLDAHPGFRMAQPEYSLHMFLSNEFGQNLDDVLDFMFYWLNAWGAIVKDRGTNELTLANYIQKFKNDGVIDDAKQLQEQRMPINEDAKFKAMNLMRDQVISTFKGRDDFEYFGNPDDSVNRTKPYVLVDVEGVYHLYTPYGEAFWGWSNTSPKVAFGTQSATQEGRKRLAVIVSAMYIHAREAIAGELGMELAKIDPLETGALFALINVKNVQQRAQQDGLDPTKLSSDQKKVYAAAASNELESKLLADFPTMESALQAIKSDAAMNGSKIMKEPINVAQIDAAMKGIYDDEGYATPPDAAMIFNEKINRITFKERVRSGKIQKGAKIDITLDKKEGFVGVRRGVIFDHIDDTDNSVVFYLPESSGSDYVHFDRLPLRIIESITIHSEFVKKAREFVKKVKERVKSAIKSQFDRAQITPGGIDLNSGNLNMQSQGQKVSITFDPAMIAQFRRGDFSGVRIQILDVVPVNLISLLALH